MASDIDICNTGLFLVGADEITSFQDDTREAKISNVIYETTKQALLSCHIWNFSLKFAELAGTTLASTAAAYDFDYKYEYTLPSDFLRMAKTDDLNNSLYDHPYEIVGKKLYTNASPVNIQYQSSGINESTFPAPFQRAFELELAKLYAASLLQDETQVELWSKLARDALMKAKTIDASDDPGEGIDPKNFPLTTVR
jgi:hypothetical protein